MLLNSEQLLFGALQFFGNPDVLRRFFEDASQQFAPGGEWFIAKILALQEEKIERLAEKALSFWNTLFPEAFSN